MLPDRLRRILILSPHCDDAVFACGEMLESHPGSIVTTIFAGRPTQDLPLTEWDRAAGFRPGDDVMAARRQEDRQALSLLGAQPLWLDFLDSQYKPTHSDTDLCAALDRLILVLRPAMLLAPLGLFHSDHLAVHEAAMSVARLHRQIAWALYEDVNYRRIPRLSAERLRHLKENGAALAPLSFPVRSPSARKLQAVACYGSQLRALASPGRPGHADTSAPERYWHVMWNT